MEHLRLSNVEICKESLPLLSLYQLKTLSVIFGNLETFPLLYPNHLTLLNLKGNSITTLNTKEAETFFQRANTLQELNLSHNDFLLMLLHFWGL